MVKEAIELRHKISEGKKQLWCLDLRKTTKFRMDAMNHAEKHGQEYLTAFAIVIDSNLLRFIMNTMEVLRRSKIPYKAFIEKSSCSVA